MMLIYRFNSLIRNRVVWTVFAGLVVLSFVAWQTRTDRATGGADAAPGMLDGQPVPAAEWRDAYFHATLGMSLMMGRPVPSNPRTDKALREMAWRRLVSLRAAREARLEIAPDEIVAAIQQQPVFQENGQFNQARYRAFIQQYLGGLRATERQFEEHIRQELLLAKARVLVSQAVWVAPLELQEMFHQLYDTFVLSYTVLRGEELAHAVTVTDAAAQAYYEAHRDAFAVPETRRVAYVTFPFAAYLDEGAIVEPDLRTYYEEHIEEFTAAGTNDLLSAPSFEAIEDELRDRLALERAISAAGDRAADFEVALAPDRRGQAPAFEDAARQAGLAVARSGYFTRTGAVAGLAVDQAFNRAAFDLRRTPDDYFSHPVRGSNAYYLLAYDDRTEKRIPPYAEIQAEVRAAARAAAVSNWLDETAGRVRQAAAAALPRGATLAGALRPFGLEVVTTDPFSVRGGLEPEDPDPFYALTRQILTMNAGELTEPIPFEGGMVIGHVDARIPADRSVFESLRPELARYVRMRRNETAFRQWQEALLVAHRFKDTSGAAAAGSDDATNGVPGDAEDGAEADKTSDGPGADG